MSQKYLTHSNPLVRKLATLPNSSIIHITPYYVELEFQGDLVTVARLNTMSFYRVDYEGHPPAYSIREESLLDHIKNYSFNG